MSGQTDSTNIDDLPNGTNQENANMNISVNENPTEYKPINDVPPPSQMDPNSVNEILSQTNDLASTGALNIPIRDVPRNTQPIHSDEQAQHDYMQHQQHPDYIDNWESNHEMIYDQQKSDNQRESLEVLYEQFQLPILIMLLYFFFHLPVVNKWFFKTFSFCFMKDGNMNFQGYVLKSIIFATLFYIIHKNMVYLSNL
jgi:hypothetical protein